MIVKYHAARAGTVLRRGVEGVRRVLIARTDGLAFHDDGPEADHAGAAAVVAAVLGLAQRAAAANVLGELRCTTVRGADGNLVVYAVDHAHVLAVFTEPTANLVLLDRVALRLAGELAGAEAGSAGSAGAAGAHGR
ncbi:roadblock/LC7 domain-containing protein [Kineococcus auxinigenes]|uniref:roadblock/LC7 domain-containing protein n=1 Tax=unclassified Kineococcus TaxID=2621656 RepID=UPI003D7EA7AF